MRIISANEAGAWGYPRQVIESQGWNTDNDGKPRQPRLVVEVPKEEAPKEAAPKVETPEKPD